MNDVNMASDHGDRPASPLPPSFESPEQRLRRVSIKAIMADDNMTAPERRLSIQALMDGRRRSSANARNASGLSGMAAAAAIAAMECFDDDDSSEDDERINNINRNNKNEIINNTPATTTSFGPAMRRRSSRAATIEAIAENAIMDHESVEANSSIYDQHSLALSAAMAYYESQNSRRALELSKRMENLRPECNHYERNCTIIAACCGMAFGCRLCHDESDVLPPPIFEMQKNLEAKHAENEAAAMSEEASKRRVKRALSMPVQNLLDDSIPDHHNIDRFAIAEVICRRCFTRQSSKGNNCRACGVQFGEYHCIICNLWMSGEERPYHCSDCGFCRVGGRENFKHCFDCGMCIDANLFSDHNCKVGKYMSNCPVCQEDLFSSRSASHEMPCGHAIHWHCFCDLTSYDSRCPICKKTAESHERMAPTWNAMAMAIALQPVPPEMSKVVKILCSDCENREDNRSWHFFGVQCRYCTSFNTMVLETTISGPGAAVFLAERDRADRNDARGTNGTMEEGVDNLDMAMTFLGLRGPRNDNTDNNNNNYDRMGD